MQVEKVWELCPICEEEVKLNNVFVIQQCPSCDNQILPCSLCELEMQNCNECPLEIEKP